VIRSFCLIAHCEQLKAPGCAADSPIHLHVIGMGDEDAASEGGSRISAAHQVKLVLYPEKRLLHWSQGISSGERRTRE
jgi:hypothetical protein